MWNALQYLLTGLIAYQAATDPTVHERLWVILFFSALVAYGIVWLLRRGLYLLALLLLKLRVQGRDTP